MRSLFSKIFLSTLLIYPLTRGLGFLLIFIFGLPPPLPPPPPPPVLAHVLPLYAKAAMDSLDYGGPRALAAFLAKQKTQNGLIMTFTPAPPDGCAGFAAMPPPFPGAPFSMPPPFPGAPFSIQTVSNTGRPYCLNIAPPPPSAYMPPPLHFLLLPVELLCCALVSFLLARYLSRPIGDLHAAAAAFAKGDLTARAGKPRASRLRPGNEVAALIREFDNMAERIAGLIEAQDRFIGDVSHEIKSPLARLAMAAGLARREAGGAAGPAFDRIEHEIEITSALVRELQVLSSLQGVDKLPHKTAIDLVRMLQNAISNIDFEFPHRAGSIRLATSESKIIAAGDAAILRRAVENILRNALFYTEPDDAVDIKLTADDGSAQIEIRDHGPGVPAAALPHLFEPFYRVDAARARNTGGTGIGLAICARAVALHNGKISARNAEGGGLCVMMELPVASEVTET